MTDTSQLESATASIDSSDTTAAQTTPETTAPASTPTPTPAAEATPAEAKPKTRREVIEEAYAKTTPTEAKTDAPKVKASPFNTQATKDAPATESGVVEEPTTDKEIDPITGRTLEPIKAPAGMPAALREKWGTLDRQVQKYWSDREKDIQTTLNNTTNDRKLASEIREIVTPYEPMLRQYGITATQHAKELFNFSYSLNTGTPQTKAHLIHNLITQFKPDIQTLAALASGVSPQNTNIPQQTVPPVNIEAEVEKALKAKEEKQQEAQITNAVTQFAQDPANEFYADVAQRMGKILDAELVTGKDYVEMFKNAYDLACQQTPEIKAILDQRKLNNANNAANTQNNATSVQSTPSNSNAAPKPVPQVKPSLNGGVRSKVPSPAYASRREAISAAWDKLSR